MKKKDKFPKLKKSLKNFLTDESGKITKKDALWLWIGAAMIWSIEQVSAAHCSSSGAHGNKTYSSPWVSHGNDTTWWSRNFNMTANGIQSCQHGSGIVNGHYSSTPSGQWNARFSWHANHGSHGSGHCSCWRGCW